MSVSLLVGGLVVAPCVYYLLALLAIRRFRRRQRPEPPAASASPGVSVLKPAVGAGPEITELLRSHAVQQYPEFEILVGVGDTDAHAEAAVATVRSEFPQLRIEAVRCPAPPPGANRKVTTLESLAPHARFPVWLVDDADVRVPPDHLRTVSAELAAPEVGLVTCLYRAESGPGLASRLEGLWIDAEFSAQVLLADWLQGARFGLGATLALRKRTLLQMGGFAKVRQFIGDDFQIGQMIAATGQRVRISAATVSTQSTQSEGWRDVWKRQIRWSRTIRMQRPPGHAGLALTFGTSWALVALAAHPVALWPLALAALALRYGTAIAATAAVGSDRLARDWWILPVSDLAASLVWLASYCGRTVEWAGQRHRLGPGGRILG